MKSCPGYAPMGPALVTVDEFDPDDLELGCSVNGDQVQKSRTSQMVFSVPRLASRGVLAAWLSADAKPGQVPATVREDPPLFASELTTSCGQSIGQGVGPILALWNKWLGDHWTIGDWEGTQKALPLEIPATMLRQR